MKLWDSDRQKAMYQTTVTFALILGYVALALCNAP